MSDIDLDIRNYSIKDLEKFFQLKKKYTENDVEYKEYEIRERLLSSGHVDKRFKKDLIDFLHQAKEWLVYSKFGRKTGGLQQPVSELPKNWSEDRRSSTTNFGEVWKTDPLDVPVSKQPMNREQELNHHLNKSFVQSNNSDFYAGSLNPLNVRIVSKYITIDSRFRDNTCTKTSDFSIQLPTTMNKVVSMQLTALEMPITFYGISASYGNNYLYLTASQQTVVDGPITSYEIVIIVPDGNYSAADLISTINGLLAAQNIVGEATNLFSCVQLTLDITSHGSGSGKVTFSLNYGMDIAFTITCLGLNFGKNINGENDNVDITTKIGWNLGFTQKLYSGATCYTANAPINPASMRYVYLSIGDYQRNVNKLFLTAYHNTNLNDDILARISLKGGAFSVLMENDFHLLTEPRIYFGPVDISKLRIQLFDDHGRPLNTNHTDYSFVLLFKMVYDL